MKKDLPAYVTRHKRSGKLLFTKRFGGKTVQRTLDTQFPEGAPVPVELHLEVQRLLSGPAIIPRGQDIPSVIARYRAGPEYTRLAHRTKDDYDQILDYLAERLAGVQPKDVKRAHVIRWRDEWAESSPHRANYRLRVFRIIMERAIDYGSLETGKNPAKGVAQVRYDRRAREAWPDDLVKAFRATATGQTLFLFEALLGTGQRIGDTLNMRWSDFDGQAVQVVQSKTGAKLWIPPTRELLTQMQAAEKRSVFMFPAITGQGRWSYRGAAHAIMQVRKAIGAEAYDNHALRHTATAHLARAGLDDETIMAITGHKTAAMVRLYAGPERQKARAIKAQEARK